ncbi:iron-containing alcohol dehydrogenase [Streptomyces sp. NPDC008061]|uniref:iron-containing alcohol dehydrogenase n=1 Tax=Streptomyces sp. NPDC008061 TaxID=3364805 RepID=UPI0036EEAFF1
MPNGLSAASELNALVHGDSMWPLGTDPINQALAAEGVRPSPSGLPQVVKKRHGLDGREQTVYGAHLSAVAFPSSKSGLQHKMCHVLGKHVRPPHAQTQVLTFNRAPLSETNRRLALGFGSPPTSRVACCENAQKTHLCHGLVEVLPCLSRFGRSSSCGYSTSVKRRRERPKKTKGPVSAFPGGASAR